MARYTTVAEAATVEIPKIKGSRFIADVAPCESEEAARAFVAAVRKREHAARHVCWAFRVGEAGEHARSSDDGEPSGSAGRPILAAIEGSDVTFAVVAVTRYFGGTKLGVGGLVRAYGGAAAEGLATAGARRVIPTSDVDVVVPYDALGAFEAFCARRGLERPEAAYGDAVTFVFSVPEEDAEALAAEVVDASAGRIAAAVRE